LKFAGDETFRTTFGLESSGASLVRPDGHVAWRAVELPADPNGTLVDALRRVSLAKRVRAG
jgi:hypothetical protein